MEYYAGIDSQGDSLPNTSLSLVHQSKMKQVKGKKMPKYNCRNIYLPLKMTLKIKSFATKLWFGSDE